MALHSMKLLPYLLLSVSPSLTASVQSVAQYGRLPMRFEANRGQAPSSVQFLARGANYTLSLTPSGATLDLASRTAGPATIQWRWLGANPQAAIEGEARKASFTNYLVGSGPAAWRTSVEHYARVRYHDVYPGIHLVFYGNQRQLEYDLVLAPGADYSRVRFGFNGAKSLRVDSNGDLLIGAGGGEVRQHAPVIYEKTATGRRKLAGGYRLLGRGAIGFRVEGRDPRRELVIDPVLSYSTYFGGTTSESAGGIAVDASGRAYLVGNTSSHDFPTYDAIRADRSTLPYPRQYGFLVRINAAGDDIDYATYIGGNEGETNANAVAAMADGTVFVAGSTSASDFPLVNAYKAAIDRNSRGDSITDAFVMKIGPDGRTIHYSTYVGGTDVDEAQSIAADRSGAAYVGGKTSSVNFPTPRGVQRTASGIGDAFVAKFTAAGSLEWGTYIGGRGYEDATGIALDSANDVYVAGTTNSSDFPAAPYPDNMGAYAVKLSADGSRFLWSLAFGPWLSHGRSIAVDANKNAYVVGWTPSGWYIGSAPSIQKTFGGGQTDAFVVKVNPAGNALLYSTYLGGSGDDSATGVAVDSSGNAYVVGSTASANFPVLDAVQPRLGGSSDAWVAKLNSAGAALVYSSYLGGAQDDSAAAVALDSSGGVYITGSTSSSDFPVAEALIDELLGQTNVFATKLGGSASCAITLSGTSATAPAGGGSGSIGVTAPAGCPWQATVDSGWITLSGASGSGSGTINYTVAANGTAAQRTGTINIQGAIFTIRQDGGTGTAAGTLLTSGQTVSWQLPAVQDGRLFAGTNGFRIVVPDGATRLDVVLRTATAGADTDLFVRYGSDIVISNGRAVADYDSSGTGGNESISITASSSPALRAGTYYIGIALFTTGTAVNGTLVATVQTQGTAGPPAISSGGIVGAGSSLASNVAPGAPLTLYGSNFASGESAASSLPLPLSMGGVRVLINGSAAPLFYVGPKQINVQLPYEIQPGTAQAVVETNGVRSAAMSFTVSQVGPGIIQYPLNGKLRAVVVNEDASINTPAAPARPGSIVTVYLTGAGPVKDGQPMVTGSGAPMEARWIALPYAVTIGGLSAAVEYIGLTPGAVGLYQMNVHVPALASGDYPVSLTVGTSASNTPLIAVQ